jgi:glycosyltransferase involved in cell wall biosynthesis
MIDFSKVYLWIDASNCRDGGGVTHLSNILPFLETDWEIGPVKILCGSEQRGIFHKISPNALFPEIKELDDVKWRRLIWQRYGLPKLIEGDSNPGILFVPGGLNPCILPPNAGSVVMYQNSLPFDARESLRYGLSRALLRLVALRLGQFSSFKKADGVIFLSQFAQRTISRLFPAVTEKSMIIPHGIVDFFRCPPKVKSSQPMKLLYVSTVDMYKHQWQVVKALRILVDRGYKDLHLDLIGGAYPPALKNLKRTIGKLAISDNVSIIGKVPYEELPQLYRDADIFVYASSCENLPNILLEAMASGLPMACSNREPMPEVAQDAALYFDPEQPDAIASAIEKLLLDPALRQCLSKKAFDLAGEYSWEQCGHKTAAFLRATWERKKEALSLN